MNQKSSVHIEIAQTKHFASTVADEIIAQVQDTISEKGECSIVLAGGQTPGSIYRKLAMPPQVSEVEWEKVRLFMGDERWVSNDHNQSNFRMVRETLINHLPKPGPQSFPVNTSFDVPQKAAADYSSQIREALKISESEPPRFDLVLLGIGDDGHTASIFPGSPVVNEDKEICVAVEHPSLGSRITLTPAALLNAGRIIFIASGEKKAEVLQRIIEGDEDSSVLPARIFSAVFDRVSFLLDSAAAKLLKREN